MGVDWSQTVCLKEVSAMLYKCTYCVFTLYGSYKTSTVLISTIEMMDMPHNRAFGCGYIIYASLSINISKIILKTRICGVQRDGEIALSMKIKVGKVCVKKNDNLIFK